MLCCCSLVAEVQASIPRAGLLPPLVPALAGLAEPLRRPWDFQPGDWAHSLGVPIVIGYTHLVVYCMRMLRN